MVRRKTADPDDLSLLDAALYWAKQGVAVFPCYEKRPLTTNGFKDAVKEPEAVKRLFEFYGDRANMVGAAMGDVSGMFAIDFDLYKGEEVDKWMKQLIERELLPDSRIHKTRRDGIHIFYSGSPLPQSSYPIDGVEVRGNGAYVIVPGGGAGYRVVKDSIVAAPKTLLNFLASIKKEQKLDTIDALKARILAAENLHDSISRLAARYSAMGWSQEEVTTSLLSTMRASMAASPEHPRHERWRFLVENQQGEFMRAITTAHTKYSSSAAGQAYSAAVDQEKLARMQTVAASAFTSTPTSRETTSDPVKTVSDWAGAWPFDGEGYFANVDHDLLSQRFILHPVLCEDESVLIAAEPKTGKTAIALTVGLHVATGMDLGPSLRVAEPRGVLYFGLEGRRAIRLRIAAWRRHTRELGKDVPDFIPLFVVERSKNLLLEDERQKLAVAIVSAGVWMKNEHGIDLGLVTIDTYTKAMPGGDQNSVEDTSSVFDVVNRVRELGCTAAIVFIHHKARAGNIRGSTNIEADPDVITSVSKEGDRVVWSLDRARSVEEGLQWHFKLHSHSLGTSEQGYQISAPIVEPVDAPEQTGIGEATREAEIITKIVALGRGTHPLVTIHKVLADSNLAPKVQGRRIKTRVAPWDSKDAQEFYEALVPMKGWVYGGVTIERVMEKDLIIALHIR